MKVDRSKVRNYVRVNMGAYYVMLGCVVSCCHTLYAVDVANNVEVSAVVSFAVRRDLASYAWGYVLRERVWILDTPPWTHKREYFGGCVPDGVSGQVVRCLV